MITPITRSQENDIDLATKVIIETYVAVKCDYNYTERRSENTTIKVHYTTKIMSKLTVTSMNCPKASFHYIYRPLYLTVRTYNIRRAIV